MQDLFLILDRKDLAIGIPRKETECMDVSNSPGICERNNTHNKVREFIYSPVGHVVTGNLGIIDKLGNFDQLKSVIQMGYKYRLQILMSLGEGLREILW